MADKQQKKRVVTDPGRKNFRTKEQQKLEKYRGLTEELQEMWEVKETLGEKIRGLHEDLDT